MQPDPKQVYPEPAEERDDGAERIQKRKPARRNKPASTQMQQQHRPENHEQGPAFLRVKAPETPPEAPQAAAREEAAAKEIDALKAEIDALKGQLEKAEGERAELIKQNGNLLLLLNQEKAEKQLLLPPSKKSIGERIKAIFRK